MAERDFYEILGVARTASPEAIKRAYRKLAFDLHPDRNPGDPEAERRFKELAAAYDVLSDATKRTQYDRYGHEGVRAGGFAPRDFASVEDIFRTFADIFGGGSIFEGFFGGLGGRRGGRVAARGASLRAALSLTLEEVAKGTTKTIELSRQEACATCSGSGAEPGTGRLPCEACGGRGVRQHVRGFFAVQTTCGKCRGEGSAIQTPCGACRGSGGARRKREVTVRIPPGIEEGTQIRLVGEGDAGPGGSGDLFCVLSVAPHPIFERRDDDLYCEIRLPYPLLVLGGKTEAPTIDGTTEVSVGRATRDGDVVRLRGKGLPRSEGSGRGDLFVRLLVDVPKKPTAREEEILRELEEIQTRRGAARGRRFFERVKDFFE